MKIARLGLLSLAIVCLIFSVAFAMSHTPEERGKALFNDPKFAGGLTACSSCHPDGKGLEKAAGKKEFMTPMGASKTIEEAINVCIVNANKGKAIGAKSAQMKDMVAYIKSLKKTSKKPPTPRIPVLVGFCSHICANRRS